MLFQLRHLVLKEYLIVQVYYHDHVLPTGYFEGHMADTPIIVEKSKSHD